jgi:hypothetical protein
MLMPFFHSVVWTSILCSKFLKHSNKSSAALGLPAWSPQHPKAHGVFVGPTIWGKRKLGNQKIHWKSPRVFRSLWENRQLNPPPFVQSLMNNGFILGREHGSLHLARTARESGDGYSDRSL